MSLAVHIETNVGQIYLEMAESALRHYERLVSESIMAGRKGLVRPRSLLLDLGLAADYIRKAEGEGMDTSSQRNWLDLYTTF